MFQGDIWRRICCPCCPCVHVGDGGIRFPHQAAGAGAEVWATAARPGVFHGRYREGQQGRGRVGRVHLFPAPLRATQGEKEERIYFWFFFYAGL